jgi:hypothetical protein
MIAFIFKPNLALAQDGCPPAWLRLPSFGATNQQAGYRRSQLLAPIR